MLIKIEYNHGHILCIMYCVEILPNHTHELSDQIIIPVHAFRQLMQEFQDETVLYVNLIHTENRIQYLVTITSSHDRDRHTIYVPEWIMDLIGFSAEPIFELEKADVSDLPVATRIVIKPLDPAAFNIELTECFEEAFMNLHSIQQSITIPVEWMGCCFFAYIEQVDPAPLSRIIQGEVVVEFVNSFIEDNSADEPVIENPVTEDPIIENPVEEPSFEVRRQQIRDSWLKRF